jgi:hypothetical protein
MTEREMWEKAQDILSSNRQFDEIVKLIQSYEKRVKQGVWLTIIHASSLADIGTNISEVDWESLSDEVLKTLKDAQ